MIGASGPRFVTLGETLGTFAAERTGPLMRGDSTTVSMAGSESNVAIGLARLGASVSWIGCLGADAVGDLIRRELHAEGVEVVTRTVSGSPTATMLKERIGPARWRVSYARSGSAGSAIAPADVSSETIRHAHHLHLTGITLAISPSARAAAHRALDLAGEHGLAVSFDLNHRDRLWSRGQAAEAYAEIMPRVGILFASLDEVDLLLDDAPDAPDAAGSTEAAAARDPIEIPALAHLAAQVAGIGPREVVFTLGAGGSFVWTAEDGGHLVSAEPAQLVDPVGAGDSFVAGYLYARFGEAVGLGPAGAAAFGNRVARHVVSTPGDWEGAPTLARLAAEVGDNVAR